MAEFNINMPLPPPLLRVEPFKGINLSVTPTQIDDNQASDILNMNIDERGALNKRTGYTRLFQESLGPGSINGMHLFRKGTEQIFLIAHSTKLYTLSFDEQPVEIYDELANSKVAFFEMGGKCYLLDGTNYLIYDGETVEQIKPYVPTLVISKVPGENGGGTILEDFNLLGAGFKETFSGNGTGKDYHMSLKPLDTTPVIVKVDEVTKVLTTDYTFDAQNGKITFITAPPTGTNNVEITAYKTFDDEFIDYFNGKTGKKEFQLSKKEIDITPVVASIDNGKTFNKVEGTDFTVDRKEGKVTFITAPAVGTNNVVIKAFKKFGNFKERIRKCTFSVLFGGSNDTRVFVSGNPDFPNQIWRLGLNDPTYAPENGYYKVGSESDKVQGFSKQYDYLVIEKEFSKWLMHFEIQGGEPTFPIKPINDQVGTLAKGTIQTVENNPVSLDRTGVYMLIASTLRDERNVQHISTNIDARLLRETNLENAISVDYDRKYWLAVNGNVYIFDYSINEWYIYDNINASGFIEMNGEFYFSSSQEGLIYRFYKDTEPAPFNDDGALIHSYWKSKQFVFGADELRKLVERVYFGLKPMTRTSADLYYISNKKESNLIKTSRMDLMDFRNIDFNNWSFILSQFPQEAMAKIKAKKVTHFQIILKNDKLDEGLGLLSLGIKYRYQSPVK